MIEGFIELVLGNGIEATILLMVGLFLGVLVSLLYWRRQVSKKDDNINNLEIADYPPMGDSC